MSLIRVRRKRKKDWLDTRKGKSPARLLVYLVLALAAIWYLGTRF